MRRAIGRMPLGSRMNKLEASYAERLRLLKHAGEIHEYLFEPLKLRLADNTYYVPDFLVLNGNCELELHEVKGHWEDDARVKWKATAEKFLFLRFVAVTFVRGEWKFEVYGKE